jgi:hypothetical protein
MGRLPVVPPPLRKKGLEKKVPEYDTQTSCQLKKAGRMLFLKQKR